VLAHDRRLRHDRRGRFLTITGRKKELIITSSGKNVAPTRIEGLLRAHPLVGHAVAVGDGRPYLTALIALDEEAAPGRASSRDTSGGFAYLAGHPAVREELTPTLEIRRRVVHDRYARDISSPYG